MVTALGHSLLVANLLTSFLLLSLVLILMEINHIYERDSLSFFGSFINMYI